MRFLADYFPLLLFFVAFKWQGIWVATAVAIAASVAQIAWFHFRGHVSPIHWLRPSVGSVTCRARKKACATAKSKKRPMPPQTLKSTHVSVGK